ncbi:MAG: relaxase/mobilization nuclease domain-containing protein, partial [Mogibacterium sp.]|nr:relaxase/mobilization nuclease domain-containing protein [Mogibacterium sp.]
TPDEAHAIGVQLAKELWGDRFQMVVATHVNTKCVHNHIVSAPIRGEVNPVCNW